MRIKLSNSKKFFDEILLKENLSLKKLSKKLNFNYSNLKQYRRGEKTIPDFIFNKLLEVSPNRDVWIKDKKELSNNWGAVKGANISANMLDVYERALHARKFRKIVKVNINLNKKFCEFYGALLGDGCICKYEDSEKNERIIIFLTGNLKLDANYWKYLKQLLVIEYDLNPYYYERIDDNTCVLSIRNKELCFMLNSRFEVPIGLKYGKLKINQEIMHLPWNIKKFVLRGLFDTDGCILANKRENYRYPWIAITSKSEKFRNQLISLLREKGYSAYNTGSDVCVRGIANVKRWFGDIGSSNSRNLLKYKYFLKNGYLPARLL